MHTASVWRNRSSDRCIITINTRRLDALYFGVEHEITHVIQHAEIKRKGETVFFRNLYNELSVKHPEVVQGINDKYHGYEQKIEHFDALPEQERGEVAQVLLEYHADVQACLILKNHPETKQFIQGKQACPRSKSYASYALLQRIMQQQ